MKVKDLTLENVPEDFRDVIEEKMVSAIHRAALTEIERRTYHLFARSLHDPKIIFSVQEVWDSLPEGTRDHFVNHSAFAIEKIDKAFEKRRAETKKK